MGCPPEEVDKLFLVRPETKGNRQEGSGTEEVQLVLLHVRFRDASREPAGLI